MRSSKVRGRASSARARLATRAILRQVTSIGRSPFNRPRRPPWSRQPRQPRSTTAAHRHWAPQAAAAPARRHTRYLRRLVLLDLGHHPDRHRHRDLYANRDQSCGYELHSHNIGGDQRHGQPGRANSAGRSCDALDADLRWRHVDAEHHGRNGHRLGELHGCLRPVQRERQHVVEQRGGHLLRDRHQGGGCELYGHHVGGDQRHRQSGRASRAGRGRDTF